MISTIVIWDNGPTIVIIIVDIGPTVRAEDFCFFLRIFFGTKWDGFAIWSFPELQVIVLLMIYI